MDNYLQFLTELWQLAKHNTYVKSLAQMYKKHNVNKSMGAVLIEMNLLENTKSEGYYFLGKKPTKQTVLEVKEKLRARVKKSTTKNKSVRSSKINSKIGEIRIEKLNDDYHLRFDDVTGVVTVCSNKMPTSTLGNFTAVDLINNLSTKINEPKEIHEDVRQVLDSLDNENDSNTDYSVILTDEKIKDLLECIAALTVELDQIKDQLAIESMNLNVTNQQNEEYAKEKESLSVLLKDIMKSNNALKSQLDAQKINLDNKQNELEQRNMSIFKMQALLEKTTNDLMDTDTKLQTEISQNEILETTLNEKLLKIKHLETEITILKSKWNYKLFSKLS